MVSVFLLIDASIPAKKIDLDYASWLGQNKVKHTFSNDQTFTDAVIVASFFSMHMC